MSYLITHGHWSTPEPVHAIVTRNTNAGSYRVSLQTFSICDERPVQRTTDVADFQEAVRNIEERVPGLNAAVVKTLCEQFSSIVDDLGPQQYLVEAGLYFVTWKLRRELRHASQYVRAQQSAVNGFDFHPTRQAAVDAVIRRLSNDGARTVMRINRGPDPNNPNQHLESVRVALAGGRFDWQTDVWIASDDTGEVYARMFEDAVSSTGVA